MSRLVNCYFKGKKFEAVTSQAGGSLPYLVSGALLCPRARSYIAECPILRVLQVYLIRDCLCCSHLQKRAADMAVTVKESCLVSTPGLEYKCLINISTFDFFLIPLANLSSSYGQLSLSSLQQIPTECLLCLSNNFPTLQQLSQCRDCIFQFFSLVLQPLDNGRGHAFKV